VTHALDASAIIAHLDPADAHHARATAVLSAAAGDRLVAHPLTLAECLVAAVRAGRGAEMAEVIRRLRVQVAPVDTDSPLRLAELRVTTGLRMPDCCALDVAAAEAATFVTFDRRLATAARRLGLTVAPTRH
jgi:predicted nucleic acid-binding protein